MKNEAQIAVGQEEDGPERIMDVLYNEVKKNETDSLESGTLTPKPEAAHTSVCRKDITAHPWR